MYIYLADQIYTIVWRNFISNSHQHSQNNCSQVQRYNNVINLSTFIESIEFYNYFIWQNDSL